MANAYSCFELARLSDDLVYIFDRLEMSDSNIGYKRRDLDLWISYQDQLGWIAYDPESQSVTGRPWDILPQQQSKTHPPEGIWVSRKGVKSYVYSLKYMTSLNG